MSHAQLSEDFGLLVQTSSMACNYFDRYILEALRAGPVSHHQMQMIATTCVLISAKFIDRKLPPLSELVKVHNQTATAEQFAALERVIVVALEWNLHVLLPQSFLKPLRATLPGAPFSRLDEQRTQFFMDLSVYGTCSTGRHFQPRRRPPTPLPHLLIDGPPVFPSPPPSVLSTFSGRRPSASIYARRGVRRLAARRVEVLLRDRGDRVLPARPRALASHHRAAAQALHQSTPQVLSGVLRPTDEYRTGGLQITAIRPTFRLGCDERARRCGRCCSSTQSCTAAGARDGARVANNALLRAVVIERRRDGPESLI